MVPDKSVSDRESGVLQRIELIRLRRPRFADEFITLAHGAGGKASAALIDSVFLDAFAPGSSEALPDAATLHFDSANRLAFSTDSFVVKPYRFPGGSVEQGARHVQTNNTGGHTDHVEQG